MLDQENPSEEELLILDKISRDYPFQITSILVEQMDKNDLTDPIRKQFIPDALELIESEQELADPIGDKVHEKVKGLIHRYPDRCLLKLSSICPVYCRFCFRKEMIGPGTSCLTQKEIDQSLKYIAQHQEIWEVILTGGDPLILKPKQLARFFSKLAKINHVAVVRIHTRIPVVDPGRITTELIETLKINPVVYVILHANHVNEFSEEALAACAALIDAGIPMLSQSVLLKGINDNEKALSELMKLFVKNRIKPHYLHQLDKVKGTRHFHVPIKEGQRLMRYLQGRFSGLCQPTYMLDIPGGYGKMPIGPCYFVDQDENWLVQDYLGEWHVYRELI